MKNQGRSDLQYNAKRDLILNSKKKIVDLDVFCDKGMAMPQIRFGILFSVKTECLSYVFKLILLTARAPISNQFVERTCHEFK